MLVQISSPIVFLTFSDFVRVYRALCIYYSMHLVEYVILYQPVLCLRFKSRVMQLRVNIIFDFRKISPNYPPLP